MLSEQQKDFLLGLIVLVVLIYIALIIIRAILNAIGWILKTIWSRLKIKGKYNDPLKSNDWLIRAQARQEIRFQNAMPPRLPEKKKIKKKIFRRQNKEPKWYPTGWYYDETKQMWIAPDYLKEDEKQK